MHTSEGNPFSSDPAFGALLAIDPAAFRVKFRKIVASAFGSSFGTQPGSSTKTTGISVSSSTF
ncbi:hypothetical protein [Streptomyces badius]